MLRGTELGRLVFLRRVANVQLADVKTCIDTARCVAHPSLLKVVGRVETPDTIYVASEYLSGVSLMELVNNAIERKQRIETSIAVRIIRDAVSAAAEAARLLSENTGDVLPRSIFPDTVWIAEFGETMLTEVGVAPLLHAEQLAESGHGLTAAEEEVRDDVTAAGQELLKLLTNQPLAEAEMTLPIAGELAAIVARAVNPAAPNRFKSAAEMAEALSALPSELVADEATVGDAIRKLMASVLAVRHPRRLMSVASPARPGGDEATCIFQDPMDLPPPRFRESVPPERAAAQASPHADSAPPKSGRPDHVSTEPPPAPSPVPAPMRPEHGLVPGHPAYAFLAKHGLLEHAKSLVGQPDDGDDKTLVMRPREGSASGPVINEPVQPAKAAELLHGTGGAVLVSPEQPNHGLDFGVASPEPARAYLRWGLLAGCVLLLVILVIAITIWT